MARHIPTKHFLICEQCGTQFWTRYSNGRFCERTCQDKFHNNRAKRLSLKLKPAQLEVILALEQYFINGR